ncbi:MAG: hypothetical protein ACHREM_20610 [Polyangiales bacterium]
MEIANAGICEMSPLPPASRGFTYYRRWYLGDSSATSPPGHGLK